MYVSLYFTWLKLFYANAKKLGFRESIVFIWSSITWITSFKLKSSLGTNQNITRINNRNTVTEKIGMIFSVSRDDIYGLRFITTEPNDNYFSGIRVQKIEATVLEVIQIFMKEENQTQSFYESKLQVSRKRGKGYNSTLSSYVESAR